eukprot:CAMPEP_0197596828 /NCGR_PEP_ID=MMETSP1326-20131121/25944_1 /TAXON_ID=1155430 /ORGANISM="Genus nov. species nov., Strain RCC2288" /LENGTH=89 /DNA_ID=CAMNT_0043163399 /DNA_START=191 /DNA_END=456 /DNA_ORIENTATION=+
MTLLVSDNVTARLGLMRVRDLQDILTALRLSKTGRKGELMQRLNDTCKSVILLHAAGGKERVERIINAAYSRLGGGGSSVSVVPHGGGG